LVQQGGNSDQTSEKDFLIKPPAVSLPKGGGAIKGIGEKFTANPVTGSGSLAIPIAISPGRSGFGPQLSLSYDSGAGNGPFGLGWSLSQPSIARKTDKGLPRYRDDEESDVFILSGAEDLVPSEEPVQNVEVYGKHYQIAIYRPRVEGLFARIERWAEASSFENVFWRSISRDNVTTWYGRSAESRIADPADRSRIYQWLICQSHDDKGNVIDYRYAGDNLGELDRESVWESNRASEQHLAYRYPKEIYYGNKTSYFPDLAAAGNWLVLPEEDYLFRVVFDYGDPAANPPYTPGSPSSVLGTRPFERSDVFSSHRAGFDIRCHRLCRRVLMYHCFEELAPEPVLVHATEFDYYHPDATLLNNPEAGGYTCLRAATHRSYERVNDHYHDRALPPVEFEYSQAKVDSTARLIAAEQLANLPVGTQGPGYQWVDLDGEGLSGVLSEQEGAWYYRPNRGNGQFGPQKLISPMPALAMGQGSRHQFLDLAGDGEIDVVDFSGPVPGFHERDTDEGWKRHIPFASLPNINWNDANLRFVDLTGDGHADALITEDEVFTWYPSLAEDGFASAERNRQSPDENAGPRLVFSEVDQTIFLADMCGDGLTDLVRIRNGEICYWPNLGYGRFGRKVTLGNSPLFDHVDLFDPKRIRLADIDGSGPVDIIYLGRNGAQLYYNRSGNSLSDSLEVTLPIATENIAAVQVADLLGNGTACLVWNSHLLADATAPVRYIDLMGGQKPHLLTQVKNNLGGKTQIEYTPSTRFYLDDLAKGSPWITRLPFPVHCVSKVITSDKWRKTTFATSYSYHHGYFDGMEREFRGFGRIEQTDIETYDDPAVDQAPVKTVTWYHTGAVLDRQRILNQFAKEYFPARYADRLNDPGDANPFAEHGLPEPELPVDLTADEWREALRSCKGMVLRQEIYELDPATRQEVRLYSTATHNCRIQRLQARNANRHAIFLVTESEAVSYQYELSVFGADKLKPDPRMAHTINLRHDEYGNPLQTVLIGYPRWRAGDYGNLPSSALIGAVQAEKHVAYNEMVYTEDARLDRRGQPFSNNSTHPLRHHRLRLPCETQTFELAGIPRSESFYYTPADFAQVELSTRYGVLPGAPSNPHPVVFKQYHENLSATGSAKRLVEHTRSLYFDDASDTAPPVNPLDFGKLGPRSLKYEDYKLALTSDLLDHVFADKLEWVAEAASGGNPAKTCLDLLQNGKVSGYVTGTHQALSGTANQYWMRSGIAGFASDAHEHFFLPESYTDPFNNTTTLAYDPLDLYIRASQDALGNKTEIARFDYRLLAPVEMVDINGNHTEVAFDTLGLPIALATKGKKIGSQWQGDSLEEFTSDIQLRNPSPQQVQAFCTATKVDRSNGAQARVWLAKAGSRFVYHFGEIYDSNGNSQWEQRMPGACAIVREQHQLADTPLQVSLECSDGHGNVLMKKVQAEPDPQSGLPRWIVNGLTILNNKGKPVRQYEPAFSDRFGCELPQANGVSTIMHYDAAGRAMRTDMPDGTFSKVEFSPWHVKTFDANDTVLESEWYKRNNRSSLDPHQPYPQMIPGLGTPPDAEQRTGWLAAQHANTPAMTVLDSIGREVISIAHNRTPNANGAWLDEYHTTYSKLDAEGKPLWIRDALGHLVMQYINPPRANNAVGEELPANAVPCYDIAGNLLFQHSMDAGDKWTINDAAGKPMFAWDVYKANDTATEEKRLYSTDYDALHRPIALNLKINNAPVQIIEKFDYQDAQPNPTNNLNGQMTHHYDASGLIETVRLDFKGSPLEVRRELVADPESISTNWQGNLQAKLSTEIFIQITEYDALKRMTKLFNWHQAGKPVAVYIPTYSERGTLKSERLIVGATKDNSDKGYNGGKDNAAIQEISYDAKGQRQYLKMGKDVITTYAYDSETYRLVNLRSTRSISEPCSAANTSPMFVDDHIIQDLHYWYDPVGNITEITDRAMKTVYFSNQKVEPINSYEYDALYRLINATGRENGAASGAPVRKEDDPLTKDFPCIADNAFRNYIQHYQYDRVGNIKQMRHEAGTLGSWTRNYQYAFEDSTQPASNRLWRTWQGSGDFNGTSANNRVTYEYDSHGSMLNLANTPDEFKMQWDHRDMISSINLGSGFAHYQYDAGKQRTRKYITKNNGNIIEERIYLGGVELYRKYEANNPQPVEEIETLHLFDGERRLLMVDQVLETDNANLGKRTLYRYTLSNHLGSSTVELDEQAGLISYEEYHPYGTSAYRGGRNVEEVNLKRYRYTGMERDEESGLSYHSARYYLPWLGRWGSADPIGVEDDFNIYLVFRANPLFFRDINGCEPVNFVEYANNVQEGLQRIKELGVNAGKEYGLAQDPGTGKLLVLEGGQGSMNFGSNLIPLGHTHTGTDLTNPPSTADLDLFVGRGVREHWIFGKKDEWARLRYDAQNGSWEMTRSSGMVMVRSTISRDPNFNPNDTNIANRIRGWIYGAEEPAPPKVSNVTRAVETIKKESSIVRNLETVTSESISLVDKGKYYLSEAGVFFAKVGKAVMLVFAVGGALKATSEYDDAQEPETITTRSTDAPGSDLAGVFILTLAAGLIDNAGAMAKTTFGDWDYIDYMTKTTLSTGMSPLQRDLLNWLKK